MTIEEIKKIQSEIPELSELNEAPAMISHTLHHPDIIFPGVTPNVREQILKLGKEFRFTEKSDNNKLKYIDLFAGIGGFRKALDGIKARCVFSSEWDERAKQTYFANFNEVPFGDIREISPNEVPNHDILCAGFPCQPFSIAGVSKKNSMGLSTGFQDKTQGTLFFEICKILEAKRPRAFFLENVKNLLSHDKRRTWQVIVDTLENDLHYHVLYKVVDGKHWVPQHRERVFIIGFDKERYPERPNFCIPEAPREGYKRKTLIDILESNPPEKYTIGPGTWEALQRHKERHTKAGNGFGFTILPEVIQETTITATLSARYYKDGAEILIPQEGGLRPRRLTVGEACELQGFDRNQFIFPVSDNNAYKQLGNSVVVPAVRETGIALIHWLEENSV